MSKDCLKESISAVCMDCGAEFTISCGEQVFYKEKGYTLPKRCKSCRDKRRVEKQQAQSVPNAKDIEEQKQNDAAEIKFILESTAIKQVELSALKIPDMQKTLFVIGNGFDIMHGAASRYWDFQKTLGKNSELRFHIETYLQVEEDKLWYNFEDSLSHINAGVMLDVVDMWLNDFDVYKNGAESMADFHGAIDAAMLPMQVLTSELPRRFRMWAETLRTSGVKPFSNLISKDAVYLNFNYTEFLETVYDVPKEKIKYIHGCRKKVKFQPKEKLILGHVPNVDYLRDYKPTKGMVPKYKDRWKRALLERAMEIAAEQWVTYYEDTFTKHTPEIIAENKEFFAGMNNIADIVVIGHSLSDVDYPYFAEIVKVNSDKAKWHISYHSLGDLKNIMTFLSVMNIPLKHVEVFHA